MADTNDILDRLDRYDELMSSVSTEITNEHEIDIITEMAKIEDLFNLDTQDLCISKIDGTGEPDEDYANVRSHSWSTTSNNNMILEVNYRKDLNIKRRDGIYIFNLDKKTDEEESVFKIGRKIKLKKKDIENGDIIDRWSYIIIGEERTELKIPISQFKCNCNKLEIFVEYMQWEFN